MIFKITLSGCRPLTAIGKATRCTVLFSELFTGSAENPMHENREIPAVPDVMGVGLKGGACEICCENCPLRPPERKVEHPYNFKQGLEQRPK